MNRTSRKIVLRAAALAVLVASLAGCAAYVDVVADPAPDKVYVCHKGKKTLEVSASALDAHLGHGDTRGRCR